MLEKRARKAATRVCIRDMWTLLLVKRTEQNNLLRMSVNNTERKTNKQKENNTFTNDFRHPFSLQREQNPGCALAEAT